MLTTIELEFIGKNSEKEVWNHISNRAKQAAESGDSNG